jgi:class 3 adenylate cyclase
MSKEPEAISYSTPTATNHQPKRLVAVGGPDAGTSFTFYDRVEVGRFREDRMIPGVLLLKDQTVSSNHCTIIQEPDGRCFVRDTSRNGTRLDGRRLSPNLKSEVKVGQVLSVGRESGFRLEGESPVMAEPSPQSTTGTMGLANPTTVTVLVGDIREYTVLVQQQTSSAVQESVGRVFQRLEKAVVELGGTLKEFQGDAIFAFWEEGSQGNHAVDACKAALALQKIAEELAEDSTVWQVEDHPLRMDWALATGPVVISGYGSEGALGLSMVGESVVLAFRIEKFADDTTGSIIACPVTRKMASKSFKFKDLGSRQAKGFESSHQLYSLVGEKKWPFGS